MVKMEEERMRITAAGLRWMRMGIEGLSPNISFQSAPRSCSISLFAWLLVKVMESVLFYFPIYFIASASITIFAVGFLFVVLSSTVPIRYAMKVDTERVLRERTAG